MKEKKLAIITATTTTQTTILTCNMKYTFPLNSCYCCYNQFWFEFLIKNYSEYQENIENRPLAVKSQIFSEITSPAPFFQRKTTLKHTENHHHERKKKLAIITAATTTQTTILTCNMKYTFLLNSCYCCYNQFWFVF